MNGTLIICSFVHVLFHSISLYDFFDHMLSETE